MRPAFGRPFAQASEEARHDILRFLTCGSVDDGKSTLIGRLLHETDMILDDQRAALQNDSRRFGTTGDGVDYALLMDGLEAEREQGITIDVAHRYFSTSRRTFIVADTPGHDQYTRNMVTGASGSDLAVILLDACKGVVEQTRRHSTICSLLGIRQVILAVNKMDLVDFNEARFRNIVDDFKTFAGRLSFDSVTAIPISARFGDNVTIASSNTPWHVGPTLLGHLEAVDTASNCGQRPFRFPVQWVNRSTSDFRGLSGTVVSGHIRRGDPVIVANSGAHTTIARIVTADGDLEVAEAGEAVTLTLEKEVDVARGDILASPNLQPDVADHFAAHVVWMGGEPLIPNRSYMMRIGTRWVPAAISTIKHKLSVDELQPLAAKTLSLNEIGLCHVATTGLVACDSYETNRATGSFILVDRDNNQTVAAGMILFALRRATNIHREHLAADKAARALIKNQKPCVLWFTGLPASGKSTIARLVEARLHEAQQHTYMLDGDNLRHGLNRDLGFTVADRAENIRRVGEVAKLFVDSGLIVMCAFISPFRSDRRSVREMLGADEFFEIFVDTPRTECARRDPKGLYAKAEAGLMKNFTGYDSPYEEPEHPDLVLRTMEATAEELADRVIALLRETARIR